MTGRTESTGPKAPADVVDGYDPFRATRPTVLVHDVDLATFELAWRDSETRCPLCGRGTAGERGASPFDDRRWVRFTCGDVIAVEQTAG